MFTGIVEQTGEVAEVTDDAGGRRVRVRADLDNLHHGQSIAVSGACLTVEDYGEDWFDLFLSVETVEKTYLGTVEPGDQVNIERALPADGRLDGHVVQGHVDTTAEVAGIEQVGDGPASESSGASSYEDDDDDEDEAEYDGDWTFEFSLPEGFERYLVPKGSVTVDGISLTVADLDEDSFGVAVIPATYDITTLSEKSVGDPVHIEVDVMAKYVERLLASDADLTASQAPYAERFEE